MRKNYFRITKIHADLNLKILQIVDNYVTYILYEFHIDSIQMEA